MYYVKICFYIFQVYQIFIAIISVFLLTKFVRLTCSVMRELLITLSIIYSAHLKYCYTKINQSELTGQDDCIGEDCETCLLWRNTYMAVSKWFSHTDTATLHDICYTHNVLPTTVLPTRITHLSATISWCAWYHNGWTWFENSS